MESQYEHPARVQSLLFDREQFTVAQARAWAKKHKFQHGSVDEKPNTIRLRQFEPGECGKETFGTKELTMGVKAVMCGQKENPKGPIHKYSIRVQTGAGEFKTVTVQAHTEKEAWRKVMKNTAKGVVMGIEKANPVTAGKETMNPNAEKKRLIRETKGFIASVKRHIKKAKREGNEQLAQRHWFELDHWERELRKLQKHNPTTQEKKNPTAKNWARAVRLEEGKYHQYISGEEHARQRGEESIARSYQQLAKRAEKRLRMAQKRLDMAEDREYAKKKATKHNPATQEAKGNPSAKNLNRAYNLEQEKLLRYSADAELARRDLANALKRGETTSRGRWERIIKDNEHKAERALKRSTKLYNKVLAAFKREEAAKKRNPITGNGKKARVNPIRQLQALRASQSEEEREINRKVVELRDEYDRLKRIPARSKKEQRRIEAVKRLCAKLQKRYQVIKKNPSYQVKHSNPPLPQTYVVQSEDGGVAVIESSSQPEAIAAFDQATQATGLKALLFRVRQKISTGIKHKIDLEPVAESYVANSPLIRENRPSSDAGHYEWREWANNICDEARRQRSNSEITPAQAGAVCQEAQRLARKRGR